MQWYRRLIRRNVVRKFTVKFSPLNRTPRTYYNASAKYSFQNHFRSKFGGKTKIWMCSVATCGIGLSAMQYNQIHAATNDAGIVIESLPEIIEITKEAATLTAAAGATAAGAFTKAVVAVKGVMTVQTAALCVAGVAGVAAIAAGCYIGYYTYLMYYDKSDHHNTTPADPNTRSPSHPNYMIPNPSHPNYMIPNPSHPNYMIPNPSHPNYMIPNPSPSPPNYMIPNQSHPHYMIPNPSHPNYMIPNPSHPNTRSPSHPNTPLPTHPMFRIKNDVLLKEKYLPTYGNPAVYHWNRSEKADKKPLQFNLGSKKYVIVLKAEEGEFSVTDGNQTAKRYLPMVCSDIKGPKMYENPLIVPRTWIFDKKIQLTLDVECIEAGSLDIWLYEKKLPPTIMHEIVLKLRKFLKVEIRRIEKSDD